MKLYKLHRSQLASKGKPAVSMENLCFSGVSVSGISEPAKGDDATLDKNL